MSQSPNPQPQQALASIATPVFVQVLSAEEQARIWREECRRAATERAKWLTYEDAATSIGKSVKTVERYIAKFNIPVSEVEGARLIWHEDWHDLFFKHLNFQRGVGNVLSFPSLARREEILRAEKPLAITA
jgi:hypothetical protein